MVRVPHHDPEHGGSIFLTTLSLSMGRRVRVAVRPIRQAHGPEALEGQAHRPEEDRGEDSRAAREKSTSGGVLRRYVGATPLGARMILVAIECNYPKRLLKAGWRHMSLFQQPARRQ